MTERLEQGLARGVMHWDSKMMGVLRRFGTSSEERDRCLVERRERSRSQEVVVPVRTTSVAQLGGCAQRVRCDAS